MTGFFESLAARARGEAPAVRPRLPGIFESATAAEPFEQMEVFVETAEPAPAAPVQAAPMATEIKVRREVADRVIAAPAPAPEPVRTEATLPAAVLTPVAASAPSRSVAEAVQPRTVPSRDPSPPPVPTPVQVTADRGRREDAPPVAHQPAPASRDDATMRAVSAVTPVGPPPSLAPPARSSARDIVPQVARARPAQTPPVARPEPRREETTVHVSIGRIEVRAVQPTPEARPREPAKSAVMSLDDYLRTRRERR